MAATTASGAAEQEARPGLLPAHRVWGWLVPAVVLLAFAVLNCFWKYLATGRWIGFDAGRYYHDLTIPLGVFLRHPLDILAHPWMILVTGLLLGLVIVVPVLISLLYRPLMAAPFVAVVALLGHAPVLALAVALAVAIDCVLGVLTKLRREMPFLALIIALLPGAAYLSLSALAGVDATTVLPLQRGILYAPFLVAYVAAVLAGAVVLTVLWLTKFRQAVLCPLLVGLMAGPMTMFYVKIGADALDYALIVNRLQPGDSIFEDEALAPWVRRHGAVGLNPQTTRLRVQDDLKARRRGLVRQCEGFLAAHPDSDRKAGILWLRAQAMSLQLDEVALAGGLIKYTASFPLPASAEAWEDLRQRCSGTPQAAVADWRLGELALRAVARPGSGDPAKLIQQAEEHLHRVAEQLTEMFPAAADRQASPPPASMFTPAADMPGRDYYRSVLETVEKLIWLMERNDVVVRDGEVKDPNSAEAFGAYLGLNPREGDYYRHLKALLDDRSKQREKTRMGDNLKLAIALQTADVYERAQMLILLAEDVQSDAAIVANMELGKLAMRIREAPVIRLVGGLKTPEEYFKIVRAAPPNPYQRKADELLAFLAARPTTRP